MNAHAFHFNVYVRRCTRIVLDRHLFFLGTKYARLSSPIDIDRERGIHTPSILLSVCAHIIFIIKSAYVRVGIACGVSVVLSHIQTNERYRKFDAEECGHATISFGVVA